MKVAKVRYELEHLLALRHFKQVDVECRELLLVINGINNAKYFQYDCRLRNYYGECDENKDEYGHVWVNTNNKPRGVYTDCTKQHEIQLNYNLPPGTILVRLEPGMAIPKGAKPIQPKRRLPRNESVYDNGYGKGNETDTRDFYGSGFEYSENTNGFGYKNDDSYNDYSYSSITKNYGYADTPTPTNIVGSSNSGDIRRKSFKYDPHKINVKNPYSAGFFPSPNIANVVSSSFNPYSKTGFYPQQDIHGKPSSKSSPTTTATSKKSAGMSDDSESQQSTQESSFDIQIQIEPVK